MPPPTPSSGPERTPYVRPNDGWVCGHACEGKPCRLGPTPSGGCPAAPECQPVLEKVSGEEKGRWKCTRPKEHGGPCADGPSPNGTCGCPVIACAPQRSLRNIRGRFILGVITLSVALLMLALGGPWRWRFITPAPVSQPHRGAAFARLAGERIQAVNECAACHETANTSLSHWVQNALDADPGMLSPNQFRRVASGVTPMTAIDRESCASCHDRHELHQPNVVQAHSCSVCHREHHGLRMPSPSDLECAHCHADAAVMAASSARGRDIPSLNFDPPIPAGVTAFHSPRPPGGRTNLFTTFWEGHPDFGVRAAGLRDPNTLKFNHALHLGETVRLSGRSLVCANCHTPDATGVGMARIRYDTHCVACHDLQFDPAHPELKLPHGDIAAVRGVLRGLPAAYADLRAKALTSLGQSPRKSDVDSFVRENVARMRQTFGSGEELERLIAFTGDPRRQQPGLSAERRAHFAGCAYCHEVTPARETLALITPPVIPDRWMLKGRFVHSRHVQQNCEGCHAVRSSQTAADINLPSQTTCALCHQPNGGAPSGCATCHTYHLLRAR